mgnify:CR=1 FL=1
MLPECVGGCFLANCSSIVDSLSATIVKITMLDENNAVSNMTEPTFADGMGK